MESPDGLTTQPELSLREQIAANLAEAEETAPPTESTPTQPQTSTEVVSAEPVETAEHKAGRTAGRPRDEKGRLLPGKPEVAPAQAVTAPVAAETAPTIKRPTTWKKETWPVYDKLASGQPISAAEAKIITDEISRREGDFANGVSTYRQEAERARELYEAIAPFQGDLEKHNIPVTQWITNLGNAHRQLALGSPQDKLAMFQRLAQDYGIPAQLAVQDQQGQWQLLVPPRAQPQFNPQDIQRIVQQQVQQTLQSQSTRNTVAEFERVADEKYPHYATVKQDMARLLEAGLSEDLESAYHAAIRLPKHSEIFDAMQQQQREDADRKALEVKKQQVTRARANAVSTPSSTPAGSMATTGDKDLREQLTENLRSAIGGRV